MKTHADIELRLVKSSESRRLNAESVRSLSASMAESGLINPIYVKRGTVYAGIMTDGFIVVAGDHRVAAARALGWKEIAAVIVDDEDDAALELIKIDENLMRNELTATERAEHLQRRKEIWEAMRQQVAQVDPPVEVAKHGHAQDEGFAAATAEATGISKASTNRAVRRATEVCQAARDLIRGTKLDTGTFLDRLAKADVSPKEQVDRVREALAALAQDEEGERLRKEAEARKEAAKEASYDACNRIAQFLFEKLTNREWTMLIHDFEVAGWSLQAKTLRNWEAPSRAA